MTDRDLRLPGALRPTVEDIVEVTDAFCSDHLDDEYAHLCRLLTAKLARKRPSPLARGNLHVWAAGVIHTVGTANFLFDRTQYPHMRVDELARVLGVSKSTMTAKAALIRRVLGIDPLEPELCRREIRDHHPYAWFVELDGLIIDARSLPAPLQEDARRRGLVPTR
jgi:Domain of unknown function (DUF6398)